MADEGAMLVLRDGGDERSWSLGGGEPVVIGRDADCAVCLPDRSVSRHHAEIRRSGQGFVLADQGSKNGTWLNGQPVGAEPRRLKDGDDISIAARYKLWYVDADATAPLAFAGRGLRIDAETMHVYVNGQVLAPPLSAPQLAFLKVMLDADGGLVPRESIIPAVWPESERDGVSDDSIDALVKRVRQRLAEHDARHSYIVTIRGYGFRLDQP